MPETTDPSSRYIGAVLGQCLGDALGFVVEGYPSETCRRYVDEYLSRGRAGELGRGEFPFGQYTDDSQLMRELLLSFLSNGVFDPADYGARIAAIFADGRIVGRGRSTEAGARRIAAGVPWYAAGSPPPAAGNGSAMRAGAIGLICPEGGARLARMARDQSICTHADPRCVAGAIAVAAATARGVRGEPVHATPFCEELVALTEPYDNSVAAALRHLPSWLRLSPVEACGLIAATGHDPSHGEGWEGISPFVTASVLWSLYSFLRSPDSYWKTLCTAIAVGGDVDTTAAMAGCISGAHLGSQAVPEALADRLTDQGSWGPLELTELAIGVCRTVQGRFESAPPSASHPGTENHGQPDRRGSGDGPSGTSRAGSAAPEARVSVVRLYNEEEHACDPASGRAIVARVLE